MNRRVRLYLCSIFFVVIIIGIWWMYERIAAPSSELQNQLKAVIQEHNPIKIKMLSEDDSTASYLLGLPKDINIRTTEFQGGSIPRPGVEIGYFPAKMGEQAVSCYMVLNTHSFSLVPHWKLVKVSLDPIMIDPKWAQTSNY